MGWFLLNSRLFTCKLFPMHRIFLLLAVFTLSLMCDFAAAQPVPQFSSYPANATLFRLRTEPVLDTPEKRNFRTRIRDASRQPPNFAGEYVLTTWGCGTSCEQGAVINLRTGAVSFLPATVCCWGDVDQQFRAVEFRKTSRLVVLSGQLNEQGQNAAHFFEFRDGNFIPVTSIVRATIAPAAGPPTSNHLPNQILGLLKSPSSKPDVMKAIATAPDVNTRLEGGLTPLIAASYVGDSDIVGQLLQRGAKPATADDMGRTSLWFATMRRDLSTIRLLLSRPDRKSFLDIGGAELGVTPLHMALDRGDQEVAKMLVEAGASLEITDKLGRTPRTVCQDIPTQLPSITAACSVLP